MSQPQDPSRSKAELPVVVIGGGGHSKVLIDTLQLLGRRILFATDQDETLYGQRLGGVEIRPVDALLAGQPPDAVELAHGVGSNHRPQVRQDLHASLTARGFVFATLVHPSAVVAKSAALGRGAQVMAGAVVQPDAQVGEDVIVNTRSSIDHDCRIGAHTHLAPGTTLSGGVRVGEMCHIGTGASVIQGVRIGDRAVVGAGAVVIRDIPDGAVCYGVPARVAKHPHG